LGAVHDVQALAADLVAQPGDAARVDVDRPLLFAVGGVTARPLEGGRLVGRGAAADGHAQAAAVVGQLRVAAGPGAQVPFRLVGVAARRLDQPGAVRLDPVVAHAELAVLVDDPRPDG